MTAKHKVERKFEFKFEEGGRWGVGGGGIQTWKRGKESKRHEGHDFPLRTNKEQTEAGLCVEE